MLKQIETRIIDGKPLPITTCDSTMNCQTKVPSRRQAVLALDTIRSAAIAGTNDFQQLQKVNDALMLVEVYLEVR